MFRLTAQEPGHGGGRGDAASPRCKTPSAAAAPAAFSGVSVGRLRREPQPRAPRERLDGRGHGQVGRPGRHRTGEASARPTAARSPAPSCSGWRASHGLTAEPAAAAGADRRARAAWCWPTASQPTSSTHVAALRSRQRATSPPWPRSSRISRRRPTKAGPSPATPSAKALRTAPSRASSR